MLSRYGVFVCMLFLCSALTACDSMEETEDMLTQQEVDALLTAMDTGFRPLGLEDDVLFGTIAEEDTLINPTDLLSAIPVDTTYACSEGGSIHLQGTITPGASASGDLVTNYDFSFTPSGCVVTVEGATFTLNSRLGVREQGMLSFEVSEHDNALTLATTIVNTSTGMVNWNLDDRSGMCDMNLSTDVTVSLTLGADESEGIFLGGNIDVEGGTTGTLCDIEVELSAELPENPEVIFNFPADTLQ